jgi:anti-sigma regulatory factor (Ser/Thr protein kinase)
VEVMIECVAVPLSDVSSVGEARRRGVSLASLLGLAEVKSGELGIIITELARNAVIHGGGGHLIVTIQTAEGGVRVDVVAVDRGSGIKNVVRAFEDGYSTAGTPGTGMGAIRRLSSAMDVFSNSSGTAIVASVIQGERESRSGLEIGSIVAPYPGETVCGDRVSWWQDHQRTVVMVADGLGHGPLAADAADEAGHIFQQYVKEAPGEILSRIHDALKKTRGAAVAIADISPVLGTLTYAGVGNISATAISPARSRSFVSHNGTMGHHLHRIQEFKVEWPRSSMLVMHSDGLHTRWDLSPYAGLTQRSASLIAAVLLRDYRRERDDASVVVVKEPG